MEDSNRQGVTAVARANRLPWFQMFQIWPRGSIQTLYRLYTDSTEILQRFSRDSIWFIVWFNKFASEKSGLSPSPPLPEQGVGRPLVQVTIRSPLSGNRNSSTPDPDVVGTGDFTTLPYVYIYMILCILLLLLLLSFLSSLYIDVCNYMSIFRYEHIYIYTYIHTYINT